MTPGGRLLPKDTHTKTRTSQYSAALYCVGRLGFCTFRPTRQCTDVLCRFLELGYAPIDVKFPPITAPHVLYTFYKKNSEFLKNFFSYSYFDLHKLFLCEKPFFELMMNL